MFGMGGLEIVALAILGLVIFGPNQIPTAVRQARTILRNLRKLATSAKKDLEEGLGPEFKDFDVNDLNPRSFVRKHLWEEDGEGAATRPTRRRTGAAAQLNGRRPPFDAEAT